MDTTTAHAIALNGHPGPSNGRISRGSTTPSFHHTPPSNGTNAASSYSQSPHIIHNEDIIRHLYNSGFQAGNYADTLLHVHQNSYRLHAIILSRSPYLVHLMSTSPQGGGGQRVIYVDLEHEPEVTQEGFAIALGYLYSSVSLSLLRPENARGVLAAACLLGGVDDLCAYAYDACRHSITLESIDEWLRFIGSIPSTDGAATPDLHPPSSIFGPYAHQLRDDVFHFLVVTLPSLLDIHRPTGTFQEGNSLGGRDMLLQVFARVPFDLFKAAVESPDFQIGSEQARFKFAKDAVELRKRGVARGTGSEETVVLAFGGINAGGSAVHVTRKLRKKPLWKVST